MRHLALIAVALATALPPLSASADPDKDKSGHGKRKHGREYKEEYWDGNCKVERKWDKHGSFKEERKCNGTSHVRHSPPPVIVYEQPVYVKPTPVYVQPAPVYVQPAPAVVIDASPAGVVIQGTVRVK